MILGPIIQIAAFALFAFIAIAGALGMATTMSMFRSGIFLMASFIGASGLYIMLSADLLGMLQIMMYIGGMLVMILFMVLFMHDPGGAMMAGMDMSLIEKLFSRGIPPMAMDHGAGMTMDHSQMDHSQMQHGDGQERRAAGASQPGDGGMEMDHSQIDHSQMQHGDGQERRAAGASQPGGMAMDHGAMNHGDMAMDHGDGAMEMGGMEMGGMEMGGMEMDMSMTTPIKRLAAILATIIGVLLVALLLLRPAWPTSTAVPNPNSAEQVGLLLMGKYMMAFEGAGLLILIGIFGAVFLARPGAFPDRSDRAARVAHDEKPAPAEDAPLTPLLPDEQPDEDELESVGAAHHNLG